jgi:hypothetical protein
MRKNVDKSSQWEKDLASKMMKIEQEGRAGVMDIPGLKRAVVKFHEANAKWKKKAVEEHDKARRVTFQAKDKGQRELHNNLKKEAANPLIAVRRRKKGPKGQQAGTIATSPKEIDAIIREMYGHVKEGEDPEEFANKYTEDYDAYIFKQPEMEIEAITAEDVEGVVRNQKETAGGMDQWMPAEFKLLSKEACHHLAMMFNMVEKGAAWPKNTTVARAAFLAKEEESDMDPLDYRVLLMLSSAYRTYAKVRLAHLQPWIGTWAVDEMYAGIEGQGAGDAAYATAIEVEVCRFMGVHFTGGAADIFKCFDQIQKADSV